MFQGVRLDCQCFSVSGGSLFAGMCKRERSGEVEEDKMGCCNLSGFLFYFSYLCKIFPTGKNKERDREREKGGREG